MLPSLADTKQVQKRDSTMSSLVSELVTSMPYLAERLTPELSSLISCSATPWYPQLQADGDISASNQFTLSRVRTALSVDLSRDLGLNHDVLDASGRSVYATICSGVRLPTGTRGIIKSDMALVLWRQEYSVWSVVGYEISEAWKMIHNIKKSTDICQTPHRTHTPNWSTNPPGDELKVSSYLKLYGRLLRLQEFLRFGISCVEAGVHIVPSLTTAERTLGLITACIYQDIPEQVRTNASNFLHSQCPLAFNPNTSANSSDSSSDPLQEIVLEVLLPSVFQLLGAVMTNVSTSGSVEPFVKHLPLWNQVLSGVSRLSPHVTLVRNLQLSKSEFSLTSSLITDQLKPFTTGQGSSAFRSDCCSGRRFKLLLSYLNFASGLLSLTKWTYSFDVESFGGETATLTSISHTCFNLLKGTLLLVVRQLIGSGLYHNNPSSGLQSCLLGRPMDSYLALAEGCLILLTDLLTTRVSKQDVYSMYCNLEKSAWGQSGDDCLTDLNSSNLLSSLQYLALHLLMNTPSALSCLLTFSSVPLGTLLARFMISDHGFSLCAQMDSSNRPSVHNAGGKLARVVWFALTLVHHLLGFEHSVMAGKGSSPVYGPLLSGIRSRYDPLTGSHYVAILFSYLRYPYSVGVARSAIVVLKWLTQYSDLKLADCLGKNMNSVHSACLYRLASPTEDQLTRVELFDLLAETVLCRQPNTVAAGPSGVTQQPSDFLRFLLSSSSLLTTRGNSWLGTELTSELSEIPSRKRDCLECALVVLEEVQSSRKRGHLDQLSILLFWAVSKFIAAIYLQNLQTCINALNSKPKFWELFTGPIFSLLKLEDTKDELQSIVTELCGHIISVLSLELYALLSFQGPSKTNADLLNVIKRLVDEGGYSSWFALIHKNLQDLGCCDDDSVVQSQLLSVYEATCRWKCLLLIHLKLVAMSEADESKKTDLPLPWPDVDVIARHIINCLSLLKKIVDLPEAWALGDQLATCLTTVLTYKRQCRITKSISSPPKKKDEPLNHLQSCLEKLTGLLVDLQPVGNEQLHHTHADLLASCYLITRTIDQDCSLGADSFKELYLNLFECAFGYLSLLSSCSKLSATNENALCQSANLIMLVWSRIEHSLISERLFQTGILNNLLIILEQQSKEKKGAELCHCILSLLTRLICDFRNSSPVDADVQGVDLDKGSDQSATEHYSYTGAELIASYGELLSKVFSWPPVEILLQWVQEDETASSQCDSSPCLQLDSGTISQNTKYPWSGAVGGWSKLILVELHFLCTLHDLLGGLNHPFFGRLISIFCSDNAPHLELLSKLWCQPLYELRLTGSSLSPLPFTSVLLHNNILVPSRLKIAECIYALFWRLSLAGHSLNLDSVTTGSGLPTIGFNVLFHAGVSGETDGNMSQQPAFLPAYGPSLPSEFRAAVFRMTELQIHCCSVLLQRPGLRFAAKSSSVSYTTPVKTVGSNPRLHPSVSPRQVRSQTPLAKTGESPGPHSNAADAIGSADCSGEIELTIVARHLITCLSLLSVQIPLLGTLGLLTSEELRQLRSPVHLIFNTPTFDDLSPQLTFGILTTLAHSLGYLITKLTAHLKASHPTDASSESKKELRSLLSNAHEMTLSIIFSQATLILASDQPSVAEKQLLIRELSAELKSCNAFGRFSRRAHSLSHRSSVARSSRSPSSRSSSVTHHRHLNSSPQTPGPGSVLSTSFGPEPSGTKLTFSDSVTFGFEQAVERFAELIRLTG
ncbi:unnamed protein product [Calicophoron daubneyi]|uniref:Uncharacterized protein n=1 Tax=Calicophoron daubneyi TaxID=300641 RepID=A0AAV2TC76_CALDB